MYTLEFLLGMAENTKLKEETEGNMEVLSIMEE